MRLRRQCGNPALHRIEHRQLRRPSWSTLPHRLDKRLQGDIALRLVRSHRESSEIYPKLQLPALSCSDTPWAMPKWRLRDQAPTDTIGEQYSRSNRTSIT